MVLAVLAIAAGAALSFLQWPGEESGASRAELAGDRPAAGVARQTGR